MPRADGFLTTADAARLVRVEPVTIRQWRKRGYLAAQGLDERNYPLHTPEAVRAAEKTARQNGLNSVTGVDPRRLRGRGRRKDPVMPGPSDLEQRVAAIEEKLAAAENVSVHFTSMDLDNEQLQKLEKDLAAALADGPRYMVMPPRPLLTPETARALLRECVTVVQPGETLAVRCPDSWNAQQVDEINRYAAARTEGLGISVLFVPGEEFATVRPDPDDSVFREKLRKHLPEARERALAVQHATGTGLRR